VKPWESYLTALHDSGVIRGYQASWLSSALSSTKFAALGARQIGKGWTVALVAITLAHGYVTASGEFVPPHDVIVLSKDQRTSKNMISMIRKHLDLCEQMFGVITSTRLGGLSEIYLEGRGKIVSMPGSPRSIQGFTGSVIIDELAANRWDPEELIAQGLSVTSSRNHFRFMLISNAGISGGFAHQFFEGDGDWADRRKDFQIFSTTIYDAYPDGLPDRLLSLRRVISPKMWARFYENSFEGAGIGILERGQVRAVTSAPKNLRMIMGIDPGFSDNPTGVIVAGVDQQGGIYIVYSDWWFSVGIDDQAARIKQLISHYRPAKTIIDRGMAGFALESKFSGDTSIEFIGVNAPNKQRMLATTVDLIESGRVCVLSEQTPPRAFRGNHEIFWNDLETIQWAENGALDIGTTIVREGDAVAIQRGAKPGTRIHADTAMGFAYCAEWLSGFQAGGQRSQSITKISRI